MSNPAGTGAPLPRAGLERIAPYVGGEAAIAGRADVVKLSANESPLGASPRAMEAARTISAGMSRYPDGGASELRRVLALRHGIEAERIVCGAGSDELLHLLAQAFLSPGDEAIHSAHGFLVYPIATRAAGGVPIAAAEANLRADVDALLAAVSPRTRMLFLANPNNPTGSHLSAAELRRLRAGLRSDILLVLDAAYAEYGEADETYESGLALARESDNVVATRTFSKAYGLAGLRLGWCYGAAAVVETLNRIRGPFNVSIVAQSAGLAALEDEAHLRRAVEHNKQWLPWLERQIAAAGFPVFPSVANFLLIRLPAPFSASRADAFLQQRGLLLRRMEAYGLPDCLRLSVGLEEENHRVAEAFRALAEAEAGAGGRGKGRAKP